MEKKYRTCRIIDGKPRWIIVDENGNVINRNPTKEELKGLDKFSEKDGRSKPRHDRCYTEEELLDFFLKYIQEYGIVPTEHGFRNNHRAYPSPTTYIKYFGSWSNALKLVGLDVDSMVKNGVIETNQQKARLAEIVVRNHFKKHPVDLAGKNQNSPYDGICPNGMAYDVKSSGLDGDRWSFSIYNICKDDIEIYYLIAFNEDYTGLEHAWRVSAWLAINKDRIRVGLNSKYELNIENMKECEITDKIKDIINNIYNV